MTISKASMFTSLIIASSLLFVGCSNTTTSSNSNETKQAAAKSQVNEENKTKSAESQDEKKIDSPKPNTTSNTAKQDTSSNVQTNEKDGSLTLKVEEKDKYTPLSPSGWKSSPSSHYQVTIDGRGQNASEEGQGSIVVENKTTLHATLYSLPETIGNDLTPKYAEWINDHNLYVIIGYPYGTVTKGGSLYKLNIDTHILTPVIVNLPAKEEIMSVYKNNDNTFMYKKNVYDDDNYTKSHIVEGKVPEGQN